MAHIGITWHMDETAHARAENMSAGGGVLKIGVDERCIHYPNLDIYMSDRGRARLAAAAINGDLAELLSDLDEYLDLLTDGAPDAGPVGQRAIEMQARIRALAPKPAKVTA